MSTDLDVALTMVSIAERASSRRTRERNENNARRALDTILNFYHETDLTEDERKLLDPKITHLKAALGQLLLKTTKLTHSPSTR